MNTETQDLAAKLRAQHERDTALGHRSEWTPGWQYAVVWRFQETPTHNDQADARASFPRHLLRPPSGNGGVVGGPWELNVDKGWQGQHAAPPSWAAEDSRVMLQAVYWRRPAPGLHPSHPKAKIHERRQ